MRSVKSNKETDWLKYRYRELRWNQWGRLYFRRDFPNWKIWEDDDVAMVKNGTARTHYKSLKALDDAISEFEPDYNDPINWS